MYCANTSRKSESISGSAVKWQRYHQFSDMHNQIAHLEVAQLLKLKDLPKKSCDEPKKDKWSLRSGHNLETKWGAPFQ